jgi:hypothetical protein
MSTDDLGPKPEPEIEPGEPNPGGVDAVDGGEDEANPTTRDLSVEDNPAVDSVEVPDSIAEGEDTSTQATRDEESVSGEKESPA